MFLRLATRTLRSTDKRCLWKLAVNFGWRGARSIYRFKKRLRRGESFPPFLYISVLNSCNLRCQGCWVDVEAPRHMIDAATLNRVITDAKAHGNSFFGILGGEPFLHPDLLGILASHPDCYFQVFTNGQLITAKIAAELRRLGNITPLISIEGREIVSDQRRGKPEVLHRTLRGLDHCLDQRLLTGVATSLCQSNIDDLLTRAWLQELIDRGVHYVWFHTYRPVGPQMSSHLALRPDQLLRAREFIVQMRSEMPITIIDAYYDHDGKALCPMATGISHHIGPQGDVEPCPIIQFAKENIHDTAGVFDLMTGSDFLRDFRNASSAATRGCVVLERPDLVRDLVRKHAARDTTLRQSALSELESMTPRTSQFIPEKQIPERHWMYRLAKKHFFHDFGAYNPARFAAPTRGPSQTQPPRSSDPVDPHEIRR